jgi:hypothetical protein
MNTDTPLPFDLTALRIRARDVALEPRCISGTDALRAVSASAGHRLIASNSGKRLYSAAPHVSFTKAAAFASFAGPNGVDSSIN